MSSHVISWWSGQRYNGTRSYFPCDATWISRTFSYLSYCLLMVTFTHKSRIIGYVHRTVIRVSTQIAKFMGPIWDPPGSCRPQMGPMMAMNLALRACLAFIGSLAWCFDLSITETCWIMRSCTHCPHHAIQVWNRMMFLGSTSQSISVITACFQSCLSNHNCNWRSTVIAKK